MLWEGLVRKRAVATIAVATLVLFGTTGCNLVAPQATLKAYAPSDGTEVTIGDVKVLNAILLSDDGKAANLIASVSNDSDSRVQVTMQYESGSTKVDKKFSVPARGIENIGPDSSIEIEMKNIDAKPGDLFPVYIQYGNIDGKQLFVPVLDGTLAEYSDLLP